MRRGINELVAGLGDDDPAGVLDHAALTFIETHQATEHRQAGGVRGGPGRRTHAIRVQVPLRAIGRLPR